MFRRKKKDGSQPEPKKIIQVINDEMLGTWVDDPNQKGGEDTVSEPIKRDKIFENDFNTGNLKTENFPEIKIDADYSRSHLDECYNSIDYHEMKELMEMVYAAFKSSQWGNLPLNKKFSKDLMPYIFNDVFKEIDGKGYSTIDMFICIAEFMDITYEKVYEIAGLKIKERLIHELEDKYKVLSKRKTKRLF